MKLSYLAQVLEDAGLGTQGIDIFYDYMPATVTRGIMLRNPLDGTHVDPNLPGYYRTKLQAVVRATTRDDGSALADGVGRALKMFNRKFYDVDGNLAIQVNHIFPSQQPIVYPYTPGNSIEWSLNFVTSYVQPE